MQENISFEQKLSHLIYPNSSSRMAEFAAAARRCAESYAVLLSRRIPEMSEEGGAKWRALDERLEGQINTRSDAKWSQELYEWEKARKQHLFTLSLAIGGPPCK